jgi:hypothetical protein
MLCRCVVMFAVLTVAGARPARGQETGPDVRVSVGVVRQDGVFGDDSPRSSDAKIGITAGLQLRGQTHRRTGAALDVVVQPVAIGNPHFDEALRTVSVLAGAEIGRSLYVRPMGGISFQAWSGAEAESGLNLGFASGIAVGKRHVRGSRANVEGVGYATWSHGALSAIVGVQIPIRVSR